MTNKFIKELTELFKNQYKYSLGDMIKNNDLEEMFKLDVKQVVKMIEKEFKREVIER